MSRPVYGRYQAAEPPSALGSLHLHSGAPLKEVDHEPKVGVLDQSDLLAQGIHTSQFIAGCKEDADALGSCTAEAFVAQASNGLPEAHFLRSSGAANYNDVVAAQRWAIEFYHWCTDQTGDPSTEWPPTDCGSSGPYVYSEALRRRLCSSQKIAHGAENIVSLLQSGNVIQGTPFFYPWEEPDIQGFVDGDGSPQALERAIEGGVAGGHETCISAVEKLIVLPTGHVDPRNTILRVRNSWSPSWGDHGSFRIHLSTLVMLGGQCDFRQLVA